MMIVNCSVNGDHANFTQTTVNQLTKRDVPTENSFSVINDNKTAMESDSDGNSDGDDDDDKIQPSLYSNNQNGILEMSQRNETSHRAAVDFVLLPEFLAANYGENRHENSKPNQSIQIDPRQQHKRMAEAKDLCETNECKCKIETKFLTVDCNFHQVSKFYVFI